MIRVLHIFHNMGNGGIEHYVMDRYRRIDRSEIQFDFLMTSYEPGYFDDEITSLGGKIYHTCSVTRNPIKCFFQIKKIVKENNYKIVHRHTGNAIAYFDLRAAKAGGADKLIIHSHNNSAERLFIHKIAKKFLSFDCVRVACSESAGKWLFGDSKFEVLKNGIDTEKYRFNSTICEKCRNEYGIPLDSFVVGHIGRIDYQKNHEFLIRVFADILNINPNSYLMCIGDGILKENVIEQAKSLGILDRIIFTGSISNVHEVINCFDVFCFPSKYEGLGITLIEAQANGLMCFASKERVPAESNVSGNLQYIALETTPHSWAETICNSDNTRDMTAIDRVQKNGYDLNKSVQFLEHFYMKLINE